MDGLPSGPQPTTPPKQSAAASKREEVRGKLRDWVAWVRKQMGDSGDIPTVLDLLRLAINDSVGKGLLVGAASDAVSVQDLETCWGDELAQSPGDSAVRAAVLCCARSKLALLKAELDDWLDSGEEAFVHGGIEAECSRAEEMFGFLVRFLAVEDCPSTWRDFRWEILNSYLASDWERAARLYNRAEDLGLKSSGEIAMLRGQFRFLAVFGRRIEENVRRFLNNTEIRVSLESLFWEPRIPGSDAPNERDEVEALLLFENGMCDRDRELVLSDADKTLLLDAAHDLEKGFLSIPGLPYFYHAVLGRCYYCVGHFHDAAEQYNILLQSEGRPIRFLLQSGQPKASARLFASLSLSYRQAGETERAKGILERWAREFPDEKGVCLQLAELEAQAANYPRAVEYLREETDRDPAVDADWKVSALLALGATQNTSEAIKNELKNNSALWQPVHSMLKEYWEPFPKLGEKAQEKWVFGAVLVHSSGLPERMRLTEAAVACAAAVEIELRDRIFRKYREHILERASVRSTAEEGLRDHRSAKFCQFLVCDGNLTLGEIAAILKRRGGDVEPVFRDFQKWLSASQLRLMRRLEKLDAVVAFRNPAVHENRTEISPEEVIRYCRIIIEALN